MIKKTPSRTKFRKSHKMHQSGAQYSGNTVAFGEFGLQAVSNGLIKPNQIESVRVAINRSLKKSGKIIIRAFPDKPVTKKTIGSRMGKSKGNVEYWVMPILRGRVIVEIRGVTKERAHAAFKKAQYKLGFATRIVAGHMLSS